VIETVNLRLIPCELEHFEAILKGQEQLEQMLGVTVPNNWFDFPDVASLDTMRFLYKRLKANAVVFGWWTYLLSTSRITCLSVPVVTRAKPMNRHGRDRLCGCPGLSRSRSGNRSGPRAR
jgi:hypothetical protein